MIGRVLVVIALAMTLVLAGCSDATSATSGSAKPASQSTANQSPSAQEQGHEASALQNEGESKQSVSAGIEQETAEEEARTMKLDIDGTELAVDWEGNESVAALSALVADNPLAIQMSMYGGFEQVGSLGTSLPRSDVQTTTSPGDIVLYSGDQIVVFYGSNSWAYTRLGRIADRTPEELAELLGNGNVALTIAAK